MRKSTSRVIVLTLCFIVAINLYSTRLRYEKADLCDRWFDYILNKDFYNSDELQNSDSRVKMNVYSGDKDLSDELNRVCADAVSDCIVSYTEVSRTEERVGYTTKYRVVYEVELKVVAEQDTDNIFDTDGYRELEDLYVDGLLSDKDYNDRVTTLVTGSLRSMLHTYDGRTVVTVSAVQQGYSLYNTDKIMQAIIGESNIGDITDRYIDTVRKHFKSKISTLQDSE